MAEPYVHLERALTRLSHVQPRNKYSGDELAAGKTEVRAALTQVKPAPEEPTPSPPPPPPGPVGNVVVFKADHEKGDLSEYGASSLFGSGESLDVVSSPPGYGGGLCLRARVTEPDGYARGHAVKSQTGWEVGQDVWWGGAFYLPKGFFAAKQGQVDIFRWDNYEQDPTTTERGGVVFYSGDNFPRLVRIKEGSPDEQVSLITGPPIAEERWNWVEVHQHLSNVDGSAINELFVNGTKIGAANARNCTRSNLVVSRFRAGVVATSGGQTNPITVYIDRVRCGPTPTGPIA